MLVYHITNYIKPMLSLYNLSYLIHMTWEYVVKLRPDPRYVINNALLLFAMIRSVVKSFKSHVVEVADLIFRSGSIANIIIMSSYLFKSAFMTNFAKSNSDKSGVHHQ